MHHVFYVLAIASMLSYALQTTLLVRYARTMDGLSLAFYRNASFVVTLSPLLLFSHETAIREVMNAWPLLLISSLSGGVALWFLFSAYRCIPVGVASAFNGAMTTAVMTTASWVLLHEDIAWTTLAVIALVVGAIVWLGTQRNPMDHLDNRTTSGLILVLAASLFISITKMSLITLSRTIDPFAAAYFWEISIALAILCIGILRKITTGKNLERIEGKTFIGIAICAFPTLVGTGGYALAVTMGPVAIAETIGSEAIIVAALLAHWMYREKLTKKQWIAIFIILAGIVGLNLYEDGGRSPERSRVAKTVNEHKKCEMRIFHRM